MLTMPHSAWSNKVAAFSFCEVVMFRHAFFAVLLFLSFLSLHTLRGQTAAADKATSGATERYTLIMSGNKAGFQTTTQNPDGSLKVHYEFNDRGRGPNIDEVIQLSASGLPVKVEASGVDYMKAPVTETFVRKATTPVGRIALKAAARW
jgi:hypothetical protein